VRYHVLIRFVHTRGHRGGVIDSVAGECPPDTRCVAYVIDVSLNRLADHVMWRLMPGYADLYVHDEEG